MKDAINTKNNTYVESDTVKKILNEMWYGTNKINRQMVNKVLLYRMIFIVIYMCFKL